MSLPEMHRDLSGSGIYINSSTQGTTQTAPFPLVVPELVRDFREMVRTITKDKAVVAELFVGVTSSFYWSSFFRSEDI